MIRQIIRWCISNKFLVVFLAALLLVAGLLFCTSASVDVFPEFAPPQVTVATEAPGLTAEQVEAAVSIPLEALLNGMPGAQLVRSTSSVGLSSITVIFRFGTPLPIARQYVNERLLLAAQRLPTGVGPSVILPPAPPIGDILKIGLVPQTTPLMQLKTLADWDIRNRLLSVPGVARVLVYGGDEREYQVLVDPAKLLTYKLTLAQVAQAVEQTNTAPPGGFLVSKDRQIPIYGMGRVLNIGDVASSVIATKDGVPILLKHVAKVEIRPAFRMSAATVNGRPAVYIYITKQPGVDTLTLTRKVEAVLTEIKLTLPKDVQMVPVFRQADFIDRSIQNVLSALYSGGALVVVVLLFLALNWRLSIISIAAMPLALIASVATIQCLGGSINAITLGGLAIAIGEAVDDAVVDGQNVFRCLQENFRTQSPKPVLHVIAEACYEIRSSVLYSTLIVCLVFMPVFVLPGVEGKIFSPLALAYVLTVISSWCVAITLTPALCASFFGGRAVLPSFKSRTMGLVQDTYERVLNPVLARPGLILLASAILVLAGLSLLPQMGQAFLPQFRQSNLIVTMIGQAGQSLGATGAMGQALTRSLLGDPDVENIAQWSGRAPLDDSGGGPNYSEFDVLLKPNEARVIAAISGVRDRLGEMPGTTFDVSSFIMHRMNEVLSGGTKAAIAVKIFGPDLAELRRLADRTSSVLHSVRGAVDIRTEQQVLMSLLSIKINRENAARYGLTSYDVAELIEIAFNGRVMSRVLEGQRLFNLRLWFDEPHRHNIDAIRSTLIDTPSGARIPISQVADIVPTEGPSNIIRENFARRIVVQANTAGRDLVGVVNDAKQRIEKQIQLPAGYYIQYAGQYAAQQEAAKTLLWTSLFSVIGIFVLLRQALGSWKVTLLIAINLPLAAVGGIVVVAMTGNLITIGSLIGFISLFGISTRNTVLLVSKINALLADGATIDEAIVTGALTRVSPVLITALTAGMGMLPLALMGGAGQEIEQPLASVIVGGLFSSTALTLLVIPALYKMFMAPRPVAKRGLVNLLPPTRSM
ncbi:MAG TPA: efflux RND transporter permease subunit [Oculatellaceae cyanobacterium]